MHCYTFECSQFSVFFSMDKQQQLFAMKQEYWRTKMTWRCPRFHFQPNQKKGKEPFEGKWPLRDNNLWRVTRNGCWLCGTTCNRLEHVVNNYANAQCTTIKFGLYFRFEHIAHTQIHTLREPVRHTHTDLNKANWITKCWTK